MNDKPRIPKTERDIIARMEGGAWIDAGPLDLSAGLTHIPVSAFTIGAPKDTEGTQDSNVRLTLTREGINAKQYYAMQLQEPGAPSLDATLQGITALASKAVSQRIGDEEMSKRGLSLGIKSDLPEGSDTLQVELLIYRDEKKPRTVRETEKDAYYIHQAAAAVKEWLDEAVRQGQEARHEFIHGTPKNWAAGVPVNLEIYAAPYEDPVAGETRLHAVSGDITDAVINNKAEQARFLSRVEGMIANTLDDEESIRTRVSTALTEDKDTGMPVVEITLRHQSPSMRHDAAFLLALDFGGSDELKRALKALPGLQEGDASNVSVQRVTTIPRIKGQVIPLRVVDDFIPEKVQQTLDAVETAVAEATGRSRDMVHLHLTQEVIAGQTATMIYVPVASLPDTPAVDVARNIMAKLKAAGAPLDATVVRPKNIQDAAPAANAMPFSFRKLKLVNPETGAAEDITPAYEGKLHDRHTLKLELGQVTRKNLDLETGTSSILANIGNVEATVRRLGAILEVPVGKGTMNRTNDAIVFDVNFSGGKDIGEGRQQYGSIRVFWPKEGRNEKLTIEVELYANEATLARQFEALALAVKNSAKDKPLPPVKAAKSEPQGLAERSASGIKRFAGHMVEKVPAVAAQAVDYVAEKGETGLANKRRALSIAGGAYFGPKIIAWAARTFSENESNMVANFMDLLHSDTALRVFAGAGTLLLGASFAKALRDGRGGERRVQDLADATSPVSQADYISAADRNSYKAHRSKELVDIGVTGAVAVPALAYMTAYPSAGATALALTGLVAVGVARSRKNKSEEDLPELLPPHATPAQVQRAVKEAEPGKVLGEEHRESPITVPYAAPPPIPGRGRGGRGGPAPVVP